MFVLDEAPNQVRRLQKKKRKLAALETECMLLKLASSSYWI